MKVRNAVKEFEAHQIGHPEIPDSVCKCLEGAGDMHVHHKDGLTFARIGDWIVADETGDKTVMTEAMFERVFEKVKEVST